MDELRASAGKRGSCTFAYLWLSILKQLEFKKLGTNYGRLKDDGLNA